MRRKPVTNIHEVADGICRINTSIVIEGGPGGFSFNQFLIVDDALLCGDLFTQGGAEHPAITESDILGPSEAFRHAMDYFSHTQNARTMLERLASAEPTTLSCMMAARGRATIPPRLSVVVSHFFKSTKEAPRIK